MSTAAKFTPGPWTYSEDGPGGARLVFGPDSMSVAETHWNNDDARLIAAAPEMLAMLEEPCACDPGDEDWEAVCKLIDRVKGGGA